MISSDELADDARLQLAANCRDESATYSLGRGLWQIYVNGRQRLGCGFVSQQDVMRMGVDRCAPRSRKAHELKEMNEEIARLVQAYDPCTEVVFMFSDQTEVIRVATSS